MAWIYLAESEDSQSPSKNGCDQSPIARSIPIVKESYFSRYPNQTYRMLPSGMIYEPLERNGFPIEMPLISSMEVSPVRTSVLQEMERAWEESEADYFLRSCAWPKKSSPSSYSWRTFLLSQIEAGHPLSERLPRWGMIVDGVLYPLHPLERYTVARGGFYWPTPNTLDHMALRSEEALKRQFTTTRKGRTQPSNLREAIHPECWPQNLFPTPTARANRDCPAEQNRKSPALESVINIQQSTIGKKLCPQFVELLMEYPIGWTELEPWAIQWFQAKRKRRSRS